MPDTSLFTPTYNALLDAFPIRTELEHLVRLHLHVNLNAITQGNSLSEDVFRLVQWAESRGRLNELIQAAHNGNPGNDLLRALVQQIGGALMPLRPSTQELQNTMSQQQPETKPQVTLPQDASVVRKELTKAVIEQIPVVGKLVNAIVFEATKAETDRESKAKLDAQLNAIEQSLQGQTTDMGDVLVRLEQIEDVNQDIRNALLAIVLYLRNEASSYTVQVVEHSAQSSLGLPSTPSNAVPPSSVSEPIEVDRFALSIAIEEQLDVGQLDRVINDISKARQNVPANESLNVKIDRLLVWAETAEGPKLDGVLQAVKRRYPQFRYPL